MKIMMACYGGLFFDQAHNLRGKQRKTRSGAKETFTILSSSYRKKSLLKVLVPNRDPVQELYRLFPQLPPGEKPYNAYTCALHKDILLQGKLIICTNCVCFHSNIFGYETRLVIYFKNFIAVRREKTAFVVPNAISIRTPHKRYLFCSFLSRESVYKLLLRLWKTSTNSDGVNLDENDLKKTKPEKRKKSSDYNQNRIFSSYSSCDSTYVTNSNKDSLPERPHTSPPSLNISTDSSAILYTNRRLFKQSDDVTNTDSDEIDCDEDNDYIFASSELKHSKIIKSNTLSDLRELAVISDRLGDDNVEKIGKFMYARHQKIAGTQKKRSLCSTVSSINAKELLSKFYQFSNRIHFAHPSLMIIILLIVLLCFFSLVILSRINAITDSLHTTPIYPSTQSNISPENSKLQNLFHYRDNLHSVKVDRMKSILSVNLKTVNEIHEALRQLREKLK